MAKDTPNTPDDPKTVPADEKVTTEQAAPGGDPLAAETPTPDNVVPFNMEAAGREAEQAAEAVQPPEPEAPAPVSEEQAAPAKKERGGRPSKNKGEQPGQEEKVEKPPEAEKSPEVAKQPEGKKRREARPPKAPAKEEAPTPEPEKPPEPREATRPAEQEQIVFLNLSELHPFKNHPFGVRDDAEMRAMVASVADKPASQAAMPVAMARCVLPAPTLP